MRDLERSAAAGWIKIGIEHAGDTAKLELQAASLADLQRRCPEPADEILRGQSHEAAGLLRLGRRTRLRCRGLLRRGGAGGEEERERKGDCAAHGLKMHGLAR